MFYKPFFKKSLSFNSHLTENREGCRRESGRFIFA